MASETLKSRLLTVTERFLVVLETVVSWITKIGKAVFLVMLIGMLGFVTTLTLGLMLNSNTLIVIASFILSGGLMILRGILKQIERREDQPRKSKLWAMVMVANAIAVAMMLSPSPHRISILQPALLALVVLVPAAMYLNFMARILRWAAAGFTIYVLAIATLRVVTQIAPTIDLRGTATEMVAWLTGTWDQVTDTPPWKKEMKAFGVDLSTKPDTIITFSLHDRWVNTGLTLAEADSAGIIVRSLPTASNHFSIHSPKQDGTGDSTWKHSAFRPSFHRVANTAPAQLERTQIVPADDGDGATIPIQWNWTNLRPGPPGIMYIAVCRYEEVRLFDNEPFDTAYSVAIQVFRAPKPRVVPMPEGELARCGPPMPKNLSTESPRSPHKLHHSAAPIQQPTIQPIPAPITLPPPPPPPMKVSTEAWYAEIFRTHQPAVVLEVKPGLAYSAGRVEVGDTLVTVITGRLTYQPGVQFGPEGLNVTGDTTIMSITPYFHRADSTYHFGEMSLDFTTARPLDREYRAGEDNIKTYGFACIPGNDWTVAPRGGQLRFYLNISTKIEPFRLDHLKWKYKNCVPSNIDEHYYPLGHLTVKVYLLRHNADD